VDQGPLGGRDGRAWSQDQGGPTVTHHARATWTLILLLTLSSAHSAWAGPPTDQLREGIDRVVKTVRDPELRGEEKTNERRAEISKVADEIFDFTETAKRALGQHWVQRTPAERAEFVPPLTGAGCFTAWHGSTARSRDHTERAIMDARPRKHIWSVLERSLVEAHRPYQLHLEARGGGP
jgi:MlaC protein